MLKKFYSHLNENISTTKIKYDNELRKSIKNAQYVNMFC
jgi:hypothetical protein